MSSAPAILLTPHDPRRGSVVAASYENVLTASAILLNPERDAYAVIGDDQTVIAVSEAGKKFVPGLYRRPLASILDVVPDSHRPDLIQALSDITVQSTRRITKARWVTTEPSTLMRLIVHPVSLPAEHALTVVQFDEIELDAAEITDAATQAMHQQVADLQHANAELERFMYRVSHDLRAPLRSVLGLLLVMQEEPDPDTLRTYMDMIRSCVNKMDAFIKELIDLSRNSRQGITREEIDVQAMVTDVVENLRHIPGAERIELLTDIQPDVRFYSDASRLRVIINNLVSNAIFYHYPGRENPFVKIRFTTKGKYGMLSVTDNGRGIQKEHQVKIFDMFYRASEDTKGSGLGLYIVKEAVTKLNGEIHLKSVWGEGTTFTIKLVNLSA